MDTKTSAIADEPLEVLFALHPKFDHMDLAGPHQILSTALHEPNDPNSRAFECTIAGPEPQVLTDQGVLVNSQISYKEAHENLKQYDVVVVVGGNAKEWLAGDVSDKEPFALVTAYTEIHKADPTRERTLMSVCTGSLFLAKLGILSGLSATTHPDAMTTFENLCSEAASRYMTERTDVLEDARYVVNNLRFDLGDEDENPYVRRGSDTGRSATTGRKGSISLKSAGRRESIIRRASMRLAGLRVITSGGVSAGVDAALYLVGALVSQEAANETARRLQWKWEKGVVVDGLDV